MRTCSLSFVVVAAVAALALAAAPAPASARIVPQHSIAGVTLGDSPAQVKAILGAPARTRVIDSELIGRQLVYRYRYRGLRIAFSGATADSSVTSIVVTSRAQRTANGIGVGSTRAQVRRGVAGVRCRVEAGFDHCWLGRFRAGHRVTDFFIGDDGRVSSVNMGVVID